MVFEDGARHRLRRGVRCRRRDDPFVRQELVETLYHVLWELVHVFLDHRETSTVGAGAAGFLYPFLEGGTADLDAVREDVRRSIEAKAEEIGALREQTLAENDLLRGRRSDAERARCWRSATAGARRTRWTSSPTCGRAGGALWT